MHEGGGEVETSVEAYGGLFGHRTREHWVERGQVPTMVGDLRWHGGEMLPDHDCRVRVLERRRTGETPCMPAHIGRRDHRSLRPLAVQARRHRSPSAYRQG